MGQGVPERACCRQRSPGRCSVDATLRHVVSGYEVPIVILAVICLIVMLGGAVLGVLTRLVRGRTGEGATGPRRRGRRRGSDHGDGGATG